MDSSHLFCVFGSQLLQNQTLSLPYYAGYTLFLLYIQFHVTCSLVGKITILPISINGADKLKWIKMKQDQPKMQQYVVKQYVIKTSASQKESECNKDLSVGIILLSILTKMVQALICTQDWIRKSHRSLNVEDETQENEELDEGMYNTLI